jgi:hypothetical protein
MRALKTEKILNDLDYKITNILDLTFFDYYQWHRDTSSPYDDLWECLRIFHDESGVYPDTILINKTNYDLLRKSGLDKQWEKNQDLPEELFTAFDEITYEFIGGLSNAIFIIKKDHFDVVVKLIFDNEEEE